MGGSLHPTIPEGSVRLSDPRSLRAMAHPVRLELLARLRSQGPLTATQAGALVGESPANCSFHLRQLAKWGLVEEAGGGRGRERPWRATAAATTWSAAGPDQAPDRTGAAAAGQELTRALAAWYVERLSAWAAARHRESPEWQEAAWMADVALPLTAPELSQFNAELRLVVEAWSAKAAARGLVEGTRLVQWVTWTHPLPDGAGAPHE